VAAEASCDGAEVLELRKEPFDEISHLVDLGAEGWLLFAIAQRPDVRERTLIGKPLADGIAVVGAVGKQNRSIAYAVQHGLEGFAIVGLASGQLERDREPVAIDDRVDLGRVPAAGAAHAIAEPPFLWPFAPCW